MNRPTNPTNPTHPPAGRCDPVPYKPYKPNTPGLPPPRRPARPAAAKAALRDLFSLAEDDRWARRGAPWMLAMVAGLPGDLRSYRAMAEREAVLPTMTQDALEALRKAFWAVASDPGAARALESNAWAGFARGDKARRPPRAHTIVATLAKAARDAAAYHRGSVKRGQRPATAARWLVANLAMQFERLAGRAACPTPGGPFVRYMAAALRYAAAVEGGAAPEIGGTVLRGGLADWRSHPGRPVPRSLHPAPRAARRVR